MSITNDRDSRVSPFRGRWLGLTLTIIALTLLFVFLGFWQLQRLGQRRAANARIIARMDQPALALDGSALNPEQADLRRATVRGVYDPAHEIVLRNRTYNDSPGVHVITPLRISGSDAAILVDRGWIPYDQADPARRAAFAPPAGAVEVPGILRRPQTRTTALTPADVAPADGSPLTAWHRVDIARIQAQTPYPLLPVFMEQARTEGAFALPRPDPDIALDEGPHLFYAIQWFAFALIASLGYVLLLRGQQPGAGGR
jgi:surfeit locus 1 family protein